MAIARPTQPLRERRHLAEWRHGRDRRGGEMSTTTSFRGLPAPGATCSRMRVLVATDLSAAADAALAMGAVLASTPGGALAAVHVLPAFHAASILDDRTTLAVRDRVDRVAGHVPELFVEEGSAVGEILK